MSTVHPISEFFFCCANCFNTHSLKKVFEEIDTIYGVPSIQKDCPQCGFANTKVQPIILMALNIMAALLRAYNPKRIADLDGYKQNLGTEEVFNFSQLLKKHNVFSNDVKSISNFEDIIIDSLNVLKFEGSDRYRLPSRANELFIRSQNKFSPVTLDWINFKQNVIENGRFFDISPNFNRLKKLEKLKALFSTVCRIETIDERTLLYRARNISTVKNDIADKCSDQDYIIKQIGPPAPRLSTSNRMNPPGIPYFYCADTLDCCIAELSPRAKDLILLGYFRPKKQLRILNLDVIPEYKNDDIFDEFYASEEFLANFVAEISKPTIDNQMDFDYIPTQVISEYIRSLGTYDGFSFRSSQFANGKNYVFFCGPIIIKLGRIFPKGNNEELTVFTEWFELTSYDVANIKPQYTIMNHNDFIEKYKKPLYGLAGLLQQYKPKDDN